MTQLLSLVVKVNQGWVRSSFWLLGNYVYLVWTFRLCRDLDNLDRERWHSGHFWRAVWKTDNCVIVSNNCHPDNEPYLTYSIDPIIFHGTKYKLQLLWLHGHSVNRSQITLVTSYFTFVLPRLRLFSLVHRRSSDDLICVCKIMLGLLGYPCDAVFTAPTRFGLRGHIFKIRQQQFKTRHHQQALTVWLVSYWNNLPEKIVNTSLAEIFKMQLYARWQQFLFPEIPLFLLFLFID